MFVLYVAGRVGEDVVFTEEDWSSEEKSVPYEKSKRRAEMAAWELVKELPGTWTGLMLRYLSHFHGMYNISFMFEENLHFSKIPLTNGVRGPYFKLRTDRVFSPPIYGPSMKRAGHKLNWKKKRVRN